MQLLLVGQMKSSQWWIHINVEFKDSTCRVDSFCSCNVGDEGGDDDTANTVNTSINVGNIVTEGTLCNVVRASDTEVSHQNRTDNLDWISQNS